MNECLGKVAAKLSLGNVKLLGKETRSSACASRALEERPGLEAVALLLERHGKNEATEKKRSFGLA